LVTNEVRFNGYFFFLLIDYMKNSCRG